MEGKLRSILAFVCTLILVIISVPLSGARPALAATTNPETTVTTVGYKFPAPQIKPVRALAGYLAAAAPFSLISMQDLYSFGNPGEPILPYKIARILVPQGHNLVSVNVDIGETAMLKGNYLIEPGQVPLLAASENISFMPPNPEIYKSEKPFPPVPYQVLSVQGFRGYQIVEVKLVPVTYIPATGQVSYITNMKVSVTTAPTGKSSPLYRGTTSDAQSAEAMVDNPDMIESYRLTNIPATTSLAPGDYDMVIVTNSTLAPTFQSYADWRTNCRGIRTIVYDIATVLSTYTGYDDAEKLRNFVEDAYLTWGIDYVLLGGDVEIVPYRGLYGHMYTNVGWITDNVTSDVYYAALDGTWDQNNNHIYGEKSNSNGMDEADLLSEVYVARAPVNTITEAQNVCNKIESYESSNLSTYRCDWLFFATTLNSTCFGGDFKNDTETQELPSPSGFNITKVYDNLGGTTAQVVAALNAGQRIGNSAGHGNYDGFGMLQRPDVDALTNTEYCLIHTWACLTNKFQESDAISEHFLYTAHGAFAYIGNTNYGLFYNDASGPSHDYELAFYHALITDEIPRLGVAQQKSKETLSGSSDDYHRWLYYALNLLGDPSTLLRIKNDLVIHDSPGDDGSLPSPNVFWISPDIAVDAPSNGYQIVAPNTLPTHENPEYTHDNHIYIRVYNQGCENATNVTANIYWADPSGAWTWPTDWNFIGTSTLAVVPAGGSAVFPYISWMPTGTAIGHRCLLATVDTASDPVSMHNVQCDNNVSQLNVTIIELKNADSTEFVLNPIKQKGDRDLTIALLGAPKGAAATLQIPSGVQITDMKGVTTEKSSTSALDIACQPVYRVLVTSPSEGRDTTSVLSKFATQKKEVVKLQISVPSGTRGGQFTLRISEQLNGATTGGMDYIVKY